MKNKIPTVLVILDGFGYRQDAEHNAIAHASMPTFFSMLAHYPWTTLEASGSAVGLPRGFPGNSEIGHLTIGCGAVIKQPITILQEAFEAHDASKIPALQEVFSAIAATDKTLHIMGLLSDAGVHASIKHLFLFLEAAKKCSIKRVVVHPFLDSCATNMRDALHYLHELEVMMTQLGIGIIGSLHGSFYAMDRNKNWHLTELSYSVLTQQQDPAMCLDSWQTVLDQAAYENVAQEFIKPVQLAGGHYIKPGDSILFFNFRADRARQLTQLFISGNGTTITPYNLFSFITPVSYGSEYSTTVLFETDAITQTLTGLLNEQGYTICTVAESEKYHHVTYFFNGGRTEKFVHETRILIPSRIEKNKEIHYAMQADSITQATVDSLKHNPHDFYVINYANADVVAHTGNFQTTVQAVEYLDKQLAVLFEEVVVKRNGILCVTGDHGNAEQMVTLGKQKSSLGHTTNPVYFVVVKQDLKNHHTTLPLEQLSDIAPFMAHLVIDQE